MAEQKTRRDFVKTAAQVAVTAPTVAVLLNGQAKALTTDPGGNPYRGNASGPGDDFVGTVADDAGADDGTTITPGDDAIFPHV
jgi:hypothetical protein